MAPGTNAIRFLQFVPGGLAPMPADASALGTLPVAAFQYCEAIRAATSYGWYIFPPDDIYLQWDGADAYVYLDDEWQALTSEQLPDGLRAPWEEHAPEDLAQHSPPYLSNLFAPGVVQIWSGYCVVTAPDWSLHVRPPVNIVQSHAYSCYEAIIETDEFKPCPLFINVRLIATDRPIVLRKTKPLFHVQPLPRMSYIGNRGANITSIAEMSDLDWAGIRDTVRTENRPAGGYAARVRRRAKREA